MILRINDPPSPARSKVETGTQPGWQSARPRMQRLSRLDYDMAAFDVTLSDIEAARDRVAGRIRRTPAFESTEVSARLGRRTALKMEALQLAGSFKVRGVFNKVLTLSDEERRRGLVTVSGGNHAIAVARVAGTLGLDALV